MGHVNNISDISKEIQHLQEEQAQIKQQINTLAAERDSCEKLIFDQKEILFNIRSNYEVKSSELKTYKQRVEEIRNKKKILKEELNALSEKHMKSKEDFDINNEKYEELCDLLTYEEKELQKCQSEVHNLDSNVNKLRESQQHIHQQYLTSVQTEHRLKGRDSRK